MTRRPHVQVDVWYALRRAPDAWTAFACARCRRVWRRDPDEAIYRVRVINLACLRAAREVER